jgi:hypothetical protein
VVGAAAGPLVDEQSVEPLVEVFVELIARSEIDSAKYAWFANSKSSTAEA